MRMTATFMYGIVNPVILTFWLCSVRERSTSSSGTTSMVRHPTLLHTQIVIASINVSITSNRRVGMHTDVQGSLLIQVPACIVACDALQGITHPPHTYRECTPLSLFAGDNVPKDVIAHVEDLLPASSAQHAVKVPEGSRGSIIGSR